MISSNITIEELLRWRLQQAEAEAPPAPPAKQLLAMVRPWWETWPDQFQDLVARFSKTPVACCDGMSGPGKAHGRHLIPVLIDLWTEKIETSASVVHLNLRDDRLCLRIHPDGFVSPAPQNFEVTFVTHDLRPLFSTTANAAVDGEYCFDIELAAELPRSWKDLTITDRMPFRLILSDIDPVSLAVWRHNR